ncbi:MAG: VWA domain-containing protein [Salinivirgaceae bacterium]|nr:VWA domain-containing protein [Salinivirgaceae bacterium]
MKTKNILWLVTIIVVLIILKCSISEKKKEKTTETVELTKTELTDIEVTFNESDGEPQLTKNIYILFDGSGSMDEYCASQKKMDGAKKAIIQYINKIPPEYNLGLLVFGTPNDTGIEEYVALGPENHQKIIDAIQRLIPEKGTPLDAATQFGVNRLVEQYKKQLGYGEYRLVIVTDGLANEPDKFELALREASRYPFIAIYGIGLCIEGLHSLKNYSISYTDAHDYEQLGKALEKTIGELQDFDPTEFNLDKSLIEK